MKTPVICPACNSKHVIKKGIARLKYETSQVYLCKDCGKKFRENRLSHKSYKPKVITAAVTDYNLGNTIEETVKMVNRRFKVKTSTARFREITPVTGPRISGSSARPRASGRLRE